MNHRMLSLALVASIAAWAAVSADTVLAPVTPETLLAAPHGGAQAPFVLDVRSVDEYVSGHVPGAVNIPHDQLATRLAEVPKDRDVVLYCRSGRRAQMAGEVLAGHGYTRLQHLEGDMVAWQERQRPVEVPRDPAACAAALKEGKARPEACAPD